MLGPFVDATDFKSPEVGLAINNTDIKLSKNGAAGVDKNAGGGTHRNNGMYSATFNAADTDAVGELEVSVKVAGALVVVAKFIVLTAAAYDAMYAAAAAGPLQPSVAGRTAAIDTGGRVDVGQVCGNALQESNGYICVNVACWCCGPVCGTTCFGIMYPHVDVQCWKACSAQGDGGTPDVNVIGWRGDTAQGFGGYPDVNVCYWLDEGVNVSCGGYPQMDVYRWNGVGAQGIGGYPSVNVCCWLGTITETCVYSGVSYPNINVCLWHGVLARGVGYPDVNVCCWDHNLVCCLVNVNVNCWLGAAAQGAGGYPAVDVCCWLGTTAKGGGGYPCVDVCFWNGGGATGYGSPDVNVNCWLGAAAQGAGGYPCVDVCCWVGDTVPAPMVTGYPRVDTRYWDCRPVTGCWIGGVIYPYMETRRWMDCAVGTHDGLPCVAACAICYCLVGTGSISIDHNYGGTDALAYVIDGGTAVEDALVQAYLKAEYDAGNRTRNYVKAETRTGANGRWESEMRLNAGTYTLVYYKQGEYGPDIQEITVS